MDGDRLASFAVLGPAVAVVAMVVQHGLRTDLSPLEDSISLYGIGSHAYLATAATVTLGLAALALARSLRAVGGTDDLAWGAALLSVWGAGLLLLGVFDAEDGPLGGSGVVHIRIAQGAFGAAVSAVVLVSRACARLRWWTRRVAWCWVGASLTIGAVTVLTLDSPWFGVTERALAVLMVAWSVAVGRVARPHARAVVRPRGDEQ